MNIFVSGLSFNTNSEDLKELFSAFGNVTSANVIMDKFTNRSKGFGFVDMPDDAQGQQAIKEMDGHFHDGRSIKVNVARPKEERSGSKGGYQSSRGNSGSRW
jgi:RNA recognition motif-containing protein